jgi:PIN domain nuclease of toxin-antitoxin system
MRYLLDTHTIIWHLEDSPRLPSRLAEIIDNNENSIYYSSVSLWEIAIKVNSGKLELRFTFDEFLDGVKHSVIELLQIEDEHLKRLSTLPLIHRDPFDRLLIATALAEKLTIITADDDIHKYDVPWVW